jgi:hypothetical protein
MIAARLADQHGDMRLAATEADAALKRATVADDARERARTSGLRIRALLATADADAAKTSLRALAAFAEDDGSPPARFYARLAAADCAAASGDGSAGATYRQALADADALRIPMDIREATRAYSAWLIKSGDLVGAGATAERVAGWSARDYESALLQLRVQRALGDENLWHAALARALALAGERRIPTELSDAGTAP